MPNSFMPAPFFSKLVVGCSLCLKYSNSLRQLLQAGLNLTTRK